MHRITRPHPLRQNPWLLKVLIGVLLALAPISCTSESRGVPAYGDHQEMIIRILLDDGTNLADHRVFMRTEPDSTTATVRTAWQRDWEEGSSMRSEVFPDSEGRWWRAIARPDQGSDVVHSYFIAHLVEGSSTEPMHQASARVCQQCAYQFRIHLSDEPYPDTSSGPDTTSGLWEISPEQWASASLEFDRRQYEDLVQQAEESRTGAQIMLPVYTITLREGGNEVSLALESFASSSSYLYPDEQCAERLYEPVRGESTVPPGCIGRTGSGAE